MVNSKEIVFALSNILDMADTRLSLHQQRVTYIAWKIAIESDLCDQVTEDLLMASLLHDIGALSIEQKVDLIQGTERDVNRHTVIGEGLLNYIPWMETAAIYIRNHHKKWEAYATQDKEEALPCQILYLSDMVERTTNKYKDNKTKQASEIVLLITKLSGEHFSPEVVELFLRAIEKEYFWQALDSKNLHLMLKNEIPFKGKFLSIDDILNISDLIRKIIDFKSPFTATHSAGVAEVAATLGELFEYSDETIIGLRIAGNLHDIGKLTIPENILGKQGRLDDYEYEIIKGHAYQTYNTLNKIKGLGEIKNWASLHHERLNGTGYPFGYSEEELSNEVRLLSIADFFTSIIENRPYRKGMGKQKAISLLLNQAKVGLLDDIIINKLIDNFDHCYNAVVISQEHARIQYNRNLAVG